MRAKSIFPTTHFYLQPIPKLSLVGFRDKQFVIFITGSELASFIPNIDMVYFAIMLPLRDRRQDFTSEDLVGSPIWKM